MKKLIKYSSVFLLSTLLLGSCARIKTSNTVGDWHHEISRNMGGYNISSKSKLTIIRIEAGVYEYKLAITTTDQMYGGQPKTEISNGKLDEVVENGKWKFLTGDYGNRGGFIVVPSDEWENNSPNEIEIEFESGRGNSMTFRR